MSDNPIDLSQPLAARLAPVEVLDLEGQAVSLGEVWKDQPAVLVFIRHFG